MAALPLIEATDVRIVVDGVVAIERLTLKTAGDLIVLAGDPSALVAAITGAPLAQASGAATSLPAAGSPEEEALPGEASVAAGTLLLAGRDVAEGAHASAIGSALLDPPVPPGWTAEEYVTWGARLGGAPRRAARDLAAAALGRAGLAASRKRTASSLSTPERRALVLAQAAALSPEVLIAEAPLRGLTGEAASFVLAALKGVTEGRRAVLTAERLDPSSPEGVLARSADYMVLLARGEVAVEGTPGELYTGARVYALTVQRNAAPLREALQGQGIELRGGPVRFAAALPQGTTARDLLLTAKAVKATITELLPVIG